MIPQHPPASMYRTTEGLGLWEHRGKVAAVGVGHSPTARGVLARRRSCPDGRRQCVSSDQ